MGKNAAYEFPRLRDDKLVPDWVLKIPQRTDHYNTILYLFGEVAEFERMVLLLQTTDDDDWHLAV